VILAFGAGLLFLIVGEDDDHVGYMRFFGAARFVKRIHTEEARPDGKGDYS
jgi:hypothetical protein